MMELIFSMQIKMGVFYKLILSFWLCVTSHAQSIPKQKVCISLQYLQKSMGDEVDFLPAG